MALKATLNRPSRWFHWVETATRRPNVVRSRVTEERRDSLVTWYFYRELGEA